MSYEGWKNYETWAVALWIDNDEGLYRERMALVSQAWGDAEPAYKDDERYRVRAVADMLKDWIEEMAPDMGATLWGDLLTAAISEVDWYELAEHWIDEDEELKEAEA